MAETARQFFEEIEGRIDPARTAGETVSYRFDVAGAGSWHVDVDDGRVTVTESGDEADCVVAVSEETFLRIVRGEQNPTTAFMTGKLKVKGDMAHALKLQKLFS
jgi:putative sterol carrier protein